MTTKVIVKSPKNNHLAVSVDIIGITDGAEPVTLSTTIPDGEERSFYVHSMQQLRIKEVPKPK